MGMGIGEEYQVAGNFFHPCLMVYLSASQTLMRWLLVEEGSKVRRERGTWLDRPTVDTAMCRIDSCFLVSFQPENEDP